MLQEIFKFLSIEFSVFFTAALPVVELRGAIPMGIYLGLSPLHSVLLSLAGSMLPVPLILFTVRPVLRFLKKTSLFQKRVNSFVEKTINNKDGKIQKYGFWGLLLFVAVPIPGTGVWSGSLTAAILEMRFSKAFLAIFLGNAIAGALVMLLSSGVFQILR